MNIYEGPLYAGPCSRWHRVGLIKNQGGHMDKQEEYFSKGNSQCKGLSCPPSSPIPSPPPALTQAIWNWGGDMGRVVPVGSPYPSWPGYLPFHRTGCHGAQRGCVIYPRSHSTNVGSELPELRASVLRERSPLIEGRNPDGQRLGQGGQPATGLG